MLPAMYIARRFYERLSVRTLKAGVVENLLYGSVAWSPSKVHYEKLRETPLSPSWMCRMAKNQALRSRRVL